MIQSISKAPINLYFDETPLGRIITKFSRDLSQIENKLSTCSDDIFQTSWSLF